MGILRPGAAGRAFGVHRGRRDAVRIELYRNLERRLSVTSSARMLVQSSDLSHALLRNPLTGNDGALDGFDDLLGKAFRCLSYRPLRGDYDEPRTLA